MTQEYNPVIGRFINADSATLLGLSAVDVLMANLFQYCRNNLLINSDLTGYADAGTLVRMISISSLFYQFSYGLATAMAATITKISAFITGVLFPKTAAIFWWNPWVIVEILVAAIAIVITSLIIFLNIQIQNIKRNIPTKLKLPDGRVDLSKFNNPNGPKMPKGGRGILGPLGWSIAKDIDQHGAKCGNFLIE